MHTHSAHNSAHRTLLTFFLPFAAVYLCAVAGMPRCFRRSLPVAHSSLMFQAFRSLLTVSSLRKSGLLLGSLSSIFNYTPARMFSMSSILLTFMNHSNLLLLITIAISSTSASSNISSFLRCSNKLTHIAHRTEHYER